MVFVHSRKDTGKTGRTIIAKLQLSSDASLFDCKDHPRYGLAAKEVAKSRNRHVAEPVLLQILARNIQSLDTNLLHSRELQELFPYGIGMHHAGMLRSDRSLVERLFADGLLKVLCTTATLAWGVNLPAHTVIIKGTQLYNPQQGSFVQLGVYSAFNRASKMVMKSRLQH